MNSSQIAFSVLIVLVCCIGCRKNNPTQTDSQPPVVSLLFPLTGVPVKSDTTYTIIASATDDGKVTRVEFYVGGIICGIDSLAPYEYRWNTWKLSGLHSISAKAYDDVGNCGTSEARSITIDGVANHSPEASSRPFPADSATGTGLTLTLKWSCRDQDGDAITYDVFFGQTPTAMTLVGSGLKTASIIRTGLQKITTYYWKVIARGSTGGTTEGPTWSFTTNSGAPPEGMIFVSGKNFNIDKTEITYAKWHQVWDWGMAHGYTDMTAGQNGYLSNTTTNPVTMVNWYDILKWCNARSEMEGYPPVYYTDAEKVAVYRTGELTISEDMIDRTAYGYRIPTDSEWTFAAEGGTKYAHLRYSGSDVINDVAWCSTNSANTTHPVGQKAANELGIYDMTGNVWEWCWDVWGISFINVNTRCIRGGSFNVDPDNCTLWFTYTWSYIVGTGNIKVLYNVPGKYPNAREVSIGFRCVHD